MLIIDINRMGEIIANLVDKRDFRSHGQPFIFLLWIILSICDALL